MRYTFAIDWLAFGVKSPTGKLRETWTELVDGEEVCRQTKYVFKKAPHGSRQFAEIIDVLDACGNAVAQVQQSPYSPETLGERFSIVKFENRLLYLADLWAVVDSFMGEQEMVINNVSRLDLCADFNSFETMHPVELITKFLSGQLRHVGHGKGSAYFNHGAHKKEGKRTPYLNYTGLSFGEHGTDSRVYLYNKSFELLTVKNKPYIKELWRQGGLKFGPGEDVWRLELSLTSKAMKSIKNKDSGEQEVYGLERMKETGDMLELFHSFIRSRFSFVKNRPNITNITREERILLFSKNTPYFNRSVIRNQSTSTRSEKILIRQLWTMRNTYRGDLALYETDGVAKELAKKLVQTCDLGMWFAEKKTTWEVPHKK